MAITTTVLIDPKLAENVATIQYSALELTAIIDKFTVTNISGKAATITINLVTNAGAAGSLNTIIDARNIEPGECYTCPEVVGHVLLDQDFISTTAGTASALAIRASGREITA